MRYRPFGQAGQAVSAVTLSLGPGDIARGPDAGRELVFSALESGINSYRLENADPVLAEVLGQALKHVDRKLVQVSLTLGAGDGRRGSDRDFSAEGITSAIDRALNISGLGWFDLAGSSSTNCRSPPSTPSRPCAPANGSVCWAFPARAR